MTEAKNHKPNGAGLTRIIRAGRCSLQGLRTIWTNEAAFRQETVLVVLLTPLALYLGDSGLERGLLCFSLLLVLLVEIINSAIESVVDRIGPEHHPLSGAAKDLGSLAVAVTLFMAGLTWLLVLAG